MEAKYIREEIKQAAVYDRFIYYYRIAFNKNETVLQKCIRGQKEVRAYLKTYLEQRGKDHQQQSGTYFFSSSTSSTDSGSTSSTQSNQSDNHQSPQKVLAVKL